MRRLGIGHITENTVDTGNDLLIDHGRHVLGILIQQIVMQNDHVSLNRLICRIVLNGQRVNRRIEIIVIIEIRDQVLQAVIGCVIRDAVDLIAKQHAVRQLLMLVILTVVDHLHTDTGFGFHLHNEQDVIFFLGFSREAAQLIRGILHENVILCVCLDVSGNGFHLIKDVVCLLITLQTVEHSSNSAVVLIQICVKLVKLGLQLVIFLLQLCLLCLCFGDQTANRNGFGNRFTVFILAGHGSGRALHGGNLFLELGNTQSLQLTVDLTYRKIHRIHALLCCKRIVYDLREADCVVAGICHQLCDLLIGGLHGFDLSSNRRALRA